MFDINVPIGILGSIAVTMFIPDVREADGGGRLDIFGLILTGIAMATLMAGFETIGRGIVPTYATILLLLTGIVASLLYLRHATEHPHPILDLSLMRIPTFASSMLAGSLFRIAVGAMPFLLPLMLQLGFGDSAMQSGLITFAAAAGALLMKPAAQPVLRQFGFRWTLVVNGILASAFIAICAAFKPTWPSLVLDVLLLAGGFFRSLQFTAFNTIAYGDIPRPKMSAATSLYSTVQQLTLTLGIVIGAASLEVSTSLHHHTHAQVADFSIAFLLIGLISAAAIPICARLKEDAGEALSGHHVSHQSPAVSGQK